MSCLVRHDWDETGDAGEMAAVYYSSCLPSILLEFLIKVFPNLEIFTFVFLHTNTPFYREFHPELSGPFKYIKMVIVE